MPINYLRYAHEDKLSVKLLQWLEERVPEDDPIRISNHESYQFIEQLGTGRFGKTVKALHFLHTLTPPIIHSDIKARNLLITKNDTIKLANFGLVRDLATDGFGVAVSSEISLDFRGRLLYVSPEVLKSDLGPGNRMAYGLPADIWALGCTFIEMLLKHPPHFEYFGHVSEIPSVLLGYAREDNGKELPYTSEVLVPTSSKKIQLLVDIMLVKDPKRRPNTKRLLRIIPDVVNRSDSWDGEGYNPSITPTSSSFSVKENNSKFDSSESGFTTLKESRKYGQLAKFFLFISYFATRILYFLTILTKSVCYLLVFLFTGIVILLFFLVLSYFIVQSGRYLLSQSCHCDLNEPQYIIISGILIVLLFALLFSCCMVALGEYKFLIANRTLKDSRFFFPRPNKSAKLFGITIIRGKDDIRRKSRAEISRPMINSTAKTQHDEFYKDTP
ncbi:unnamed protein product [Caenorhabditis bovis]|uniref:Protein kinase domain-containing protein n=1 Tax=Caenorhabditis bovis TaxID=2654633 RepID=A0A8S1FD29_9PELO|nr:unnamed protein product [Caenorhabditis bovis]